MVKPYSTFWVFSIILISALAVLASRQVSVGDGQATLYNKQTPSLVSPRDVSCGEDLGELFLSNQGQRDTFFITLQAGDLFRVHMRFQEEGSEEQLALYGPDGSLLTSLVQDQEGPAVLRWPIDQLGVYMIVAAAADNNTTGGYGISFQNDNQPSCATLIDCGEEITSFLPLAGIEAYSVLANQNDTLRMQVQLVDPSAIPLLQLFDPLGNLLAERRGSAGELLALSFDNVPQSGHYIILVSEANGGEGGDLGFSVQGIEPSCSMPVSCGDNLAGELNSWGGMEAYHLSASAGDNLLVQLRFGMAPPLLYLYQPDGQLLDSLIGTAGTLAELFYEDLPSDGAYLIIATSQGSTAPGAYGISFQLLDQTGCGVSFMDNVCEDSAQGQVTEQAGMQAYTFEGGEDEFVAFQLEGANANFSGRIRVYDPTGQLIQSSDNSSDPIQIVPFQLPMAGTYTLLIDEAEGDDTGFFTLTGQRLGFVQPIDRTVGLCMGESVFAGGAEQTEPGIYYDLSPQENDCDEVLVTEVIRTEQVQINVVEAICFGDSLSIRGETFTETGIYPIVVPSEEGCDTLITVDLLLIEPVPSVINDTICAGQIYTLGRQGYFESGTYQDILCDSIISLTLTVLPILETQIDTTICAGQWVEINEVRYFDTGSYPTMLETDEGCDSLIHLNLTVHPLIETNIDTTICQGQWIEINHVRYFETGNYSSLLETDAGCDSLVTLDLVVQPPIQQVIDTVLCLGESIEVDHVLYFESTQDTFLLETDQNCDSLVILDLRVLDTALTHLEVFICEGSSFSVGNATYTESGEYVQVLAAANGCDSTVITDLTVGNLVFNDIRAELCQGAGFEVNGNMFFDTGFYSDTITTNTGCDSIIRLDLMVRDTFFTQVDTTICEGAVIQVGNNSYTTTGVYLDTLSTRDHCDSIIHLQLTVAGNAQTTISSDLCSGQTYTFGNRNLEESGVYRDTLSTVFGCDSLVELNLQILPPSVTSAEFRICEGETLEVNGIHYTEPGAYQDTLQTGEGCDSVLQFSLEIVNQLFTDLEASICMGETYPFDGDLLAETGNYEATFLSSAGCDSLVSLRLTVHEVKDTQLVVSLCEGEVFSIGDSTYHSTGTYQHILQTVHNCDSIVDLDLRILPLREANISVEICEGGSYSVGAETYSNPGHYSAILTSANGCDSTVNLELVVHPLPEISLTGEQQLCAGASTILSITNEYPQYRWSTGESSSSIEVSTTGLYALSVADANGCEGAAELMVEVSQLDSDISPKAFPNGFHISCPDATDGELQVLTFNGIAPYTWSWSTGSSSPTVQNLGPGAYSVSVMDAFGCEVSSHFTLQAPPDFNLNATIIPPLCVDEGGIVDVQVEGQTGPYTFEMGNTRQGMGLFEDVKAGTHSIRVTDANGCLQSLLIEVPQAEFLLEQSFKQAKITEGDSVPLLVSANFPMDKIIWEPARWLSCSDCPNPVATPEATTIYRATVFSESGCDLRAEFTIEVDPFNGFFIPNSFSPNGDGINDTYFFQADHRVNSIQEVMIFDRWGKLLYESQNLPPNDSQLGWDGRYRGQAVQLGVYTYFVRIELNDGQTRTYKGDLTLLR